MTETDEEASGSAASGSAASGRRGDVWRQFRRNGPALAGGLIVGLLGLAALTAPWLQDLGVIADPYELNPTTAHALPGGEHPLGTDYAGRDLLSRTVYGARISLSIGIGLQAIVLIIGGSIGLAAGYLGGMVDSVLMRFTDLMFAFPDLLFVLLIASVLGPGYGNILIAAGAVSWVFLARIVRGEVLAVREQDYVYAARASGTRGATIAVRHVAPNVVGPVIVTLTFGVPSAIFLEAFLSFVGVGLRPPTPSWGVMINDAYQVILTHPHEVLAPALAISLTTLSFNFIGDGLRDAIDPRMRADRGLGGVR